jgi:cystathionine beta-lyase family protein involved in aluminum resistance
MPSLACFCCTAGVAHLPAARPSLAGRAIGSQPPPSAPRRGRAPRAPSHPPQATARPLPTGAEAVALVAASAAALSPQFEAVDVSTRGHLRRVLDAFHAERVGAHHFGGVDGYGHGDLGRETLDAVYARLFGCEDAAVRIQFMSGTHAIAAVLYGVLRPGDHVVSAAGAVYDTLEEVLGTRASSDDVGSLRDWGVSFDAVPLKQDGRVDVPAVVAAVVRNNSRLVFIQRSFGYAWRPSLSVADIREVVRQVKAVRPGCVCFVDNCYGEFLEGVEPVHPSVGADVMAGSLIKNLGGGIAPSGAYVAGRRDMVARALARLTAPGVGGGPTLGMNRTLFQGLFLAPQMVGEATKGAMLVGSAMRALGYATNPGGGEARGFVQAVRLGRADKVFSFCRAVQRNGPVGSYIEPTQGVTPGYGDPVVFAQGTFIDGSTLELSADGPIRPPYVVFAQGGTHWTHWQLVLEEIVQDVGYAGDEDAGRQQVDAPRSSTRAIRS